MEKEYFLCLHFLLLFFYWFWDLKLKDSIIKSCLHIVNIDFKRQVEGTFKLTERSIDALVEFSIEKILPLIMQEKLKHEKRKLILQDFQRFFNEGAEMLKMMRFVSGCAKPPVPPPVAIQVPERIIEEWLKMA